MKKGFLLWLCALLPFIYLNAQDGWIEVDSDMDAGVGIGLISVAMNDDNVLWAMGVDDATAVIDAFTRSIDGGQTWTAGTFPSGFGLSQVFGIDANTAWAVSNGLGANQGLYKTTDGGVTWVKKGTAFGVGSFANVMHFFNDNDGFAQGDPIDGYFELYTTSDGGETWIRVPEANIPDDETGEYGIVSNVDAIGDNIWWGSNKGRVFRSTDKGITWEASLTNFGAAETVQPEFADAMNGICFRSYLNMGIEPIIGVTTDGGETWTDVFVQGSMYARYVVHVPGTENTYVGSSSEPGYNGISFSTDGGYNWYLLNEGDFMGSVWLDNETGWSGSIAEADKTTGGMYIYDGDPLLPVDVPVIEVTPDEVTGTAPMDEITTANLNIANTGLSDLEWESLIVYSNLGTTKSAPVLEAKPQMIKTLSSGMNNDVNAKPVSNSSSLDPGQRDDVTLNYDGDPDNAIFFSTPPVTCTVAAMFPPDIVNPYVGMYIESVDVFINELNAVHSNAMKLQVFDMGTTAGQAGELIAQKVFVPILGWNEDLSFDEPVYVNGGDLWVGYAFNQSEDSIAIPSIDAGPGDENGDWMKTSGGWYHLGDGGAFDNNWNIRCNLTGDPVAQWLSVEPTSGTIANGESSDITVTMDATGLAEDVYEGIVRLISNDPMNPFLDVPVTFTVAPEPESVVLDFEDIPDFSGEAADFAPWSLNDVDGGGTWGLDNTTFPGMYDPMAFIAFNPATTTPPMTETEIQPYEGEKFGACFATNPPPYNNDWLISPKVNLGSGAQFSFFVKSYTDEYGLEEYKVGVSTTGMNPEDFTIISGPTPLQPNEEAWEEMIFDLSDFINQDVYVAINCVSEDRFIFMVDYLMIQWNPTSVPEAEDLANIKVYPNPASDQINIVSSEEISEIVIFNFLGQKVHAEVVGNNEFRMGTDAFNTGIYYFQIKTESGVTTSKVMVR